MVLKRLESSLAFDLSKSGSTSPFKWILFSLHCSSSTAPRATLKQSRNAVRSLDKVLLACSLSTSQSPRLSACAAARSTCRGSVTQTTAGMDSMHRAAKSRVRRRGLSIRTAPRLAAGPPPRGVAVPLGTEDTVREGPAGLGPELERAVGPSSSPSSSPACGHEMLNQSMYEDGLEMSIEH